RLQDGQMINDEARLGMAIDQRGAFVQIVPAQKVDRKVVADGGARDPVAARLFSFVSMMRMPTVPGVFFQSATTSATAGSSGSTGFTMANRPGWARCTSTA